MQDNYRTVYRDLPYKCRGFLLYDGEDDYYTIVLNSRMSQFVQKKTFEHELEHIRNNDIFSSLSANQLEILRH